MHNHNKEAFHIRPARVSDSPGLAVIQVESYQKAYAGLFPPAYLAHFTLEEQEQDWRDWLPSHPEETLLVAVSENGEIAGYARGINGPVSIEIPGEKEDGMGVPGAPALPIQYECELASLHVRREYQRQGIGRKLFYATTKELHRQGCDSLILWVLEKNPARGFYERLGGRLVGQKKWLLEEFENFEVVEIGYAWPDLHALQSG